MTGALHIVEAEWAVYRRIWRGTLGFSFLGPLFFLASIGIGLGVLVNRNQSLGMPYLDFLAPALLPIAAMQTAVGEATYPVMAKVRWNKTYEAALATPISTNDIVFGELLWYAFRRLLEATAFVLVMLLFGVPKGPTAIGAIGAGVLTGLAFAMPVYAFAITRETDAAFSILFRFVIGPLFLFSGTFFPLDRLPAALQAAAWMLPLAHGVQLSRDLTLNTPHPQDLLHTVVLIVYIAAGTAAASITIRRRMSP
ncbi:MAG TPA: ABC transporter permease [Candidatus Dormibacteraeota bacterium]